MLKKRWQKSTQKANKARRQTQKVRKTFKNHRQMEKLFASIILPFVQNTITYIQCGNFL